MRDTYNVSTKKGRACLLKGGMLILGNRGCLGAVQFFNQWTYTDHAFLFVMKDKFFNIHNFLLGVISSSRGRKYWDLQNAFVACKLVGYAVFGR